MAGGTLWGALAKWQAATGGKQAALLVVRHGATAWNAEQRLQGRRDVPLNSQGLGQAAEVGKALQALPVVAIYCSPLSRAYSTAQAIACATGAPVRVDQDLTERAYGAMEGMVAAEMERRFPRRHQDEATVPGLESRMALRERAAAVFRRLAAEHPGNVVAAVSHGALINAFLAVATAGTLGTGVTDLANGSISVLWSDAGGWHVGAANITEHLSHG